MALSPPIALYNTVSEIEGNKGKTYKVDKIFYVDQPL
jgi:hypothetical protein